MYFHVSFPCDFDLIYFDECQVFFCFLRLVFFLFYSWVGLYYRCGLEVSLSVWSSPDLYLVCMIEFHISFPCQQASFNKPLLTSLFYTCIGLFNVCIRLYSRWFWSVTCTSDRLLHFFLGWMCIRPCAYVHVSFTYFGVFDTGIVYVYQKKTLFVKIQTSCVSTSFVSFSFCVCVYIFFSLTCVQVSSECS